MAEISPIKFLNGNPICVLSDTFTLASHKMQVIQNLKLIYL
jgi:hypothetical protein